MPEWFWPIYIGGAIFYPYFFLIFTMSGAFSKRTAARWVFFTPVWPLSAALWIVYVSYKLPILLWKTADFPVPKLPRLIGRKEEGTGQLSLSSGQGGELSKVKR